MIGVVVTAAVVEVAVKAIAVPRPQAGAGVAVRTVAIAVVVTAAVLEVAVKAEAG